MSEEIMFVAIKETIIIYIRKIKVEISYQAKPFGILQIL